MNEKLEKLENSNQFDNIINNSIIEHNECNDNTFDESYEKMIALKLGYEYINLDYLGYEEDTVKKVSSDFIKINKIMPIYEKEKKYIVACGDVFNLKAIYDITALLDKEVEIISTSNEKIQRVNNIVNNRIKDIDYLEIEDNENSNNEIDVLNTPVVKLVEAILSEAVARNASDIHIEPFGKKIKVRYRIDGMLYNNLDINLSLYQSLCARIKVLGEMNISERRKPQDGRIKRIINDYEYDFRVSTLPTIYGEKIVIRVFDKSDDGYTIDEIGFKEDVLYNIKSLISKPHGILLITGPTGCGKSTTLYSFIKELNKEGVNIITVEDPVEYTIDGINQVQVNNKIDYTFANVLRSVLRQDPNIIMIGEIRDEETAKLAMRLAITGHLVLSTLHTNDSVGAITRLEDLGVEPFFIGEALNGVIAQRLVRKLCNECKELYDPNEEEKDLLGLVSGEKIYKKNGCRACDFTGYNGRVIISELFTVNKDIREMIYKGANQEKIKNRAIKNGMTSLVDSCKEKVIRGETSIEELMKIMNEK